MTGWKHDDRPGRFEMQFESGEPMSGAKGLLASRRFWVLVVDTVISLLLYFVGKYAGAAMEDVKFLILALQPIALLLIAAWTVDDMHAASLAAQVDIQIARVGVARDVTLTPRG